jgi:hypothetical protein
MNDLIFNIITHSIDDKTGRRLVTFTPVFTPDCTASGSLRFAPWQAWEDDEDDVKRARDRSMANARTCLKAFGASS